MSSPLTLVSRARRLPRWWASVAFAVLIVLSSASAVAASPSRTIHVLLDVRAEWERVMSECVTEAVFFGFHTGSARYLDGGADVVVPEDVAGVWWSQTNVCEPSNSFFVTGDVPLEPTDFFIDRQLSSAWVDVEVPVALGSETYTFEFDLAYEATSAPVVGVAHDGSGFIRQDRLAPADVTGTVVSDIPGGFAGFSLVWSDIGSLTQVQSGG